MSDYHSSIKEILKTIVGLGYFSEKRELTIVGTGFLIDYQGFRIIVTAKRNVERLRNEGNYYYINRTIDGKFNIKSHKWVVNLLEQDWIDHPDPNIDISVNFYPLEIKKDSIRVISQDYFFNIKEPILGADVLTLCYLNETNESDSLISLVRRGTLSGESNTGQL